jgi:AraC family transcriptional regulator of adaptative response / DNA-3-methyladenine glycosylase II
VPRKSKLVFTAPYHWAAILQFLEHRLTAGLESIADGRYRRIGDGWSVTVGSDLVAVIDGDSPPDTEARLRHLFDLDVDIAAVERHLRPFLRVDDHPGLRLPGCWDPFELIVRAILGQQVSVKGAATLSARLVERFGPPTPETLAEADIPGIPKQRAACIRAAARAMLQGLPLDAGSLQKITGIGPWTAQYILMRAAHHRDAFPASDLVLMRRTGLTARGLLEEAERWRPYRAYAAMHLWRGESAPRSM